jgi:hypothetical protein
MRNVSDKTCRESQNTHFMFNNFFPPNYELTLNLLTTTIVAPPSNASKWQMGFNSVFKGLKLKAKFVVKYTSKKLHLLIKFTFPHMNRFTISPTVSQQSAEP